MALGLNFKSISKLTSIKLKDLHNRFLSSISPIKNNSDNKGSKLTFVRKILTIDFKKRNRYAYKKSYNGSLRNNEPKTFSENPIDPINMNENIFEKTHTVSEKINNDNFLENVSKIIIKSKVLLFIIIGCLLFGAGLANLYMDRDLPKIKNFEYSKSIKLGEKQNVLIVVNERNPLEYAILNINGTLLKASLSENYKNNTIIYRVSFDPSSISPDEGSLIGKLIIEDRWGNKVEKNFSFIANLKEPEIKSIRIERVSPGNYTICAKIHENNLEDAYIELQTKSEIPLRRSGDEYCVQIQTNRDLGFRIVAKDKFGLSSQAISSIIREKPNLEYAQKLKLNKSLCKYIELLDSDETMSMEEKELLDNIAYIESSLVPSTLRVYWEREELVSLQEKLFQSILEDGKISQDELNATKTILAWDRWNVARDIINSGMINDEHLKEDWDGDNLSNIFEIMIGTNPLNELEVNPNDRSEIYVVNIGGPGWGDPEDYSAFLYIVTVYHIQRKFGISNIFLIADNRIIIENNIIYAPKELLAKNLYVYKKWNRKNLLEDFGQVNFYRLGEFQAEDILNLAKILKNKVDKNDVLILNVAGHMDGLRPPYYHEEENGGFLWGIDNYYLLTNYDINQMLSQLNYGRAVVFFSGCMSESMAMNLDRASSTVIRPLRSDTLAVASAPKDRLGSSGWIMWVWEYLATGIPIKKVGEKIRDPLSNLDFIVYCFPDNDSLSHCSWIEEFNPLIYLPKRKG